MKVYGVTGLPGSGKSIISRIAKNEGVHIISMGDIVRKEAEKQNVSPGTAAVNLRKKYGNNVIAERCVEEIIEISRKRFNNNTTTKIYMSNKEKSTFKQYRKVEQDVFIIEGIRSPYETSIFRKNFKYFKVIAIHSSPYVRFNRLKQRKRDDDFTDFKSFLERDRRELKFGIGEVISLADFMLINDGPIPIFKNTVKGLIAREIKPKNNTKYPSKTIFKGKPNRKSEKSNKKHKKHYIKKPKYNSNYKKGQNRNNRKR